MNPVRKYGRQACSKQGRERRRLGGKGKAHDRSLEAFSANLQFWKAF